MPKKKSVAPGQTLAKDFFEKKAVACSSAKEETQLIQEVNTRYQALLKSIAKSFTYLSESLEKASKVHELAQLLVNCQSYEKQLKFLINKAKKLGETFKKRKLKNAASVLKYYINVLSKDKWDDIQQLNNTLISKQEKLIDDLPFLEPIKPKIDPGIVKKQVEALKKKNNACLNSLYKTINILVDTFDKDSVKKLEEVKKDIEEINIFISIFLGDAKEDEGEIFSGKEYALIRKEIKQYQGALGELQGMLKQLSKRVFMFEMGLRESITELAKNAREQHKRTICILKTDIKGAKTPQKLRSLLGKAGKLIDNAKGEQAKYMDSLIHAKLLKAVEDYIKELTFYRSTIFSRLKEFKRKKDTKEIGELLSDLKIMVKSVERK